MDDAQFLTRIKLLKRLGWLALFGVVLIVLAYAFGADQLHPNRPLIVFGALALVPGLVYLIVLTIWHWKGRYRGSHSDLWGALLLIETSGWLASISSSAGDFHSCRS